MFYLAKNISELGWPLGGFHEDFGVNYGISLNIGTQ